MVAQGEFAEPWKPDEPRYNRLVFIGKNLDRERIVSGFNACRDLHGYIAEAEDDPAGDDDPEDTLAPAVLEMISKVS